MNRQSTLNILIEITGGIRKAFKELNRKKIQMPKF